jgi:hypothetical protein
VWHRAIGVQPAPEHSVVLGAGLVAACFVLTPVLWHFSRGVVTIAHEGAHGAVALLCGRRLSGIKLHSDTSGLTLSSGRARGPGMIATFLAGYLGPSLFGLVFAFLLSRQHAVGVLWLALVFLALLLLQIRNLYGLWSVLVVGCGVFAVSWWADPQAQSAFAYGITWFLLMAAPRPVLELQRARSRGGARKSDADMLAWLTHVPGILWVGVFLAATVGALVVGGQLLLPRP